MKTKIIAAILAASTVFSMTACVSSPHRSCSSVKEETEYTKEFETTEESIKVQEETVTSGKVDSLQSVGSKENNYRRQLKVILDNRDKWFAEQGGPAEEYYYAVLDLDNDGFIEIVRAIVLGSGHYTYVDIHEVNDTLSGLTHIAKDENTSDFPDFLTDDVEYFDREGIRYYNVKNGIHISATESMTENTLFSVRDNKIVIEVYSSEHVIVGKNGKEKIKYYDKDSKEISKQEYTKINDSINGSEKLYSANIKWKKIEQLEDSKKLLDETTKVRV